MNSSTPIEVVYYQHDNGDVPVLEWLLQLYRRHKKAAAKCTAAIKRLAELGHELRRPQADYLHDGIYELRIRMGRVNYRILYFFQKEKAVLVHALTKEARVPAVDIERALQRKKAFESDPATHLCKEEIPDV